MFNTDMADAQCSYNALDAHQKEFKVQGVMQGVVVAFRVVDGCLRRGDVIRLMNTAKEYQVDEVGVRTPAPVPVSNLFLVKQPVCRCCNGTKLGFSLEHVV